MDKRDAVAEAGIAPRKGWLAVLMALSMFGLGQLYNGQWHRGLWVVLIGLFLMGPMFVIIALALPASWVAPGIAVLIGVSTIAWVGSILHAWWTARGLKNYQLRSWQKTGVYVAIFLAVNVAVLPLMTQYLRSNWVQPFSIPSRSMLPTLVPGDIILADMRYNCQTCSKQVKRGDVVIFKSFENPGQMWVKRVIALGGDQVTYSGGNSDVTVNGVGVPVRSLLGPRSDAVPGKPGTITVPVGEMFLIGDNRENSRDSRLLGTIPVSNVVGKVRQIYWSRGEDGVRWDRFGQLVK